MSDPESSVAASSSPSLSATDSNALNYAFLVHSQKTLTQNLPPRVDNKLLARQKRRRTRRVSANRRDRVCLYSPEDHAVLEAEYQKNPKPDKVARASIVSRVSLGEKEVQIWFQNRRQNDRRKSKPLQPHELLALRSSMTDSSAQPASDDSASAEPSSSGAEPSSDTQDLHGPRTSKPWDGEILQFSDRSDPVSEDKEEPGLPSQSSQSTVATEALDDTQTTIHEDLEQPVQDMEDASSPQPPKRKRSVSDIRGEGGNEQSSTEKSPPSLRLSLSFDGEAMVRKEGELTPSPPKSRNALRIAMSCDGKAVIRAEDEPSPSKNRVAMFSVRRTKLSGLRRSSSAIFPTTTEKDRVFGRSRDPRNWESFVDTDARSALSTPTSSQPGPNVASPGLFHSRSQRSLSRSLSARHSLLARAEAITTPISQSISEKRRKLSRTVSSLGRLENSRNRGMGYAPKPPFKPMSSKLSSKPDFQLDDDDDGDSDKENWVPGTRTSNETNRNRGLGIMTNGKRNRPFPNGNQNKAPPELSADVSAFMSGDGGASQEDDLDCVQGLLSLSQGAWR
ncbi:hypothetical protein N7474_009732 [Penicillium riverlandense]|uniref:uncharacterized protein n=1 Tax=Penicillium riverlandense TaxID=1903569 RepID=UPI0025466ECF|nr:uncharacterized protein N7474_009732 [Penicillium riverlandense]KAJ5808463.1 hypothetical protein N7474_009732 [Penicillium riverlandense]